MFCMSQLFFSRQLCAGSGFSSICKSWTKARSLVKSFRAIQNAVANLQTFFLHIHHGNIHETLAQQNANTPPPSSERQKQPLTCWDPGVTRGSTTHLSAFPSFRAPPTTGLTDSLHSSVPSCPTIVSELGAGKTVLRNRRVMQTGSAATTLSVNKERLPIVLGV